MSYKKFLDSLTWYAMKTEKWEAHSAIAGALVGANIAAYKAVKASETSLERLSLWPLGASMCGGLFGGFLGFFAPSLAPFLFLGVPGALIAVIDNRNKSSSRK